MSANPNRPALDELLRNVQAALDKAGHVRMRMAVQEGIDAFLSWLAREVATLDHVLSRQMDAVLHHPAFQELESLWRGLDYLMNQARPYLLPQSDQAGRGGRRSERSCIRIKILSARYEEWQDDVVQSTQFDRTHYWQETFAREFDTSGGEPFGLVLCDYSIRDHESLELLEGLARAAMGAFCPTLFKADPRLLSTADFSLLSRRTPEWASAIEIRIETIRRMREASFVALLLPHVRLREPYRLDAAAWPYREKLDTSRRSGALWGHAGWVYLAAVVRCVGETGWVYSLSGNESGNADAPLRETEEGIPMTCEVYVGEGVAKKLAEMGCCAAYADRSGKRVHFHRPVTFSRTDAGMRVEDGLLPSATSLPAMLAVSRIAHYLKAVARNNVGSFVADSGSIQSLLSSWLRKYVNEKEGDVSQPLTLQNVVVEDKPGGAGHFHAKVKVQLKPVWGRKYEGDMDFPIGLEATK